MAADKSKNTPVYVYNLKFKEIAKNLVLLEDYLRPQQVFEEEPSIIPEYQSSPICITCSLKFLNREDQIEHYNSSWHCYNLKQQSKGKPTITEDLYDQKEDEDSSDSDSESEDETIELPAILQQKIPKSFFKIDSDQVISIYNCLLHEKKKSLESKEKLVEFAKQIPSSLKWCIILIGGGRFATTIFNGDKIEEHKVLKRYTCRAKQGGSQHGADSKGGVSKSGGSHLRRQNEARLVEEIQALYQSWDTQLKECSLIFYQAASFNQQVLFKSKNPPFEKKDPKLRTIPFITKKPSFIETKRVHSILSKVQFYDITDFETDTLSINQTPLKPTPAISIDLTIYDKTKKNSPESSISDDSIKEKEIKSEEILKEKVASKNKKNKKKPIIKPEEREAAERRKNLKEASVIDNVEDLTQMVDSLKLKKGFDKSASNNTLVQYLNEPLDEDGNTALHLASQAGASGNVCFLMEQGADPCVKNCKNLYPYVVALDKTVRNTFREFSSNFPQKYDYTTAQVPSPLTEEQLKQRADKNMLKNKQKKLRLKEKKKEEALRNNEEYQIQKFLALNENEKISYNSESSSKNPLRCFQCGNKVTSVPFEYNNFKFCSMNCLRVHRFQPRYGQS